MASEKLTIPLTATEDRNGKRYYIGRVQFPGTIDLKEGAVFWVFVSEEGNEELQIGVMDPERERARQQRQGQGQEGPPRRDYETATPPPPRTRY